jgi:hypothetical protein
MRAPFVRSQEPEYLPGAPTPRCLCSRGAPRARAPTGPAFVRGQRHPAPGRRSARGSWRLVPCHCGLAIATESLGGVRGTSKAASPRGWRRVPLSSRSGMGGPRQGLSVRSFSVLAAEAVHDLHDSRFRRNPGHSEAQGEEVVLAVWPIGDPATRFTSTLKTSLECSVGGMLSLDQRGKYPGQ